MLHTRCVEIIIIILKVTVRLVTLTLGTGSLSLPLNALQRTIQWFKGAPEGRKAAGCVGVCAALGFWCGKVE